MKSARVNTLGKRVRYVRKMRGLTQKELAKKIYTSTSAIGYCERDEGYPTSDLLRDIAVGLNVSADFLLGIDKKEK